MYSNTANKQSCEQDEKTATHEASDWYRLVPVATVQK